MSRRTYWHLEGGRRKPSDYDIATSRLLYHPTRGFEVDVPLAPWYQRHHTESWLQLEDWEGFADPRQTTYSLYCSLKMRQEIFVEGLWGTMDGRYDERLAPPWVELLDRVMAPLRYPLHGLQMVASYIGSMAPASRIVLVCMFQAMDEMRRLQHIAYRMRCLQETHRSFGYDSRERWQTDPMWQPLRRIVERLLVTWDWGDALVALNLGVKPLFDDLFVRQFSDVARRNGDDGWERVLASVSEDARWSHDWTQALVNYAVDRKPDLHDRVVGTAHAWKAETEAALQPLQDVLS